MKKVIILMMVALTGCASTSRIRTSSVIGCHEREVELTEFMFTPFVGRTWTAECHGVKYYCSDTNFWAEVRCSRDSSGVEQ